MRHTLHEKVRSAAAEGGEVVRRERSTAVPGACPAGASDAEPIRDGEPELVQLDIGAPILLRQLCDEWLGSRRRLRTVYDLPVVPIDLP